MKINFKDNIVVFSPFGFLDGDFSKYEIDKFEKDLIISKRFECILISLKKVVHFNRVGLNLIIQTATEIARKIEANIAFCDYDESKFRMLKDSSSQGIGFSLFETQEVAGLFFSKSFGEKDQKIIVYSESQEQRSQMALKLAERGFIAHIAKEMRIFKANKDQYKYKICLSQLNMHERNITMQVRDNVIIYKLNGFIDSNFAENFDMIMHTNSLRVGFRFFAFDATKARSANIHGVSFLAKLSTASAEFGATIAICGLSTSNTSEALRNDLEDSGLLLYNDIDEFFNDEGSIVGGAGMLEAKPRNITKNIIEILPLIIKIATDAIFSISNIQIQRGGVSVKNFDFKKPDAISASIAFYGDFELKITLSLDRNLAQKACAILMKNTENIALSKAYASLISIIANKIVSWFESKNMNINTTMTRVFDDDIWAIDSVSKGAFVELNTNEPCGVLFISR